MSVLDGNSRRLPISLCFLSCSIITLGIGVCRGGVPFLVSESIAKPLSKSMSFQRSRSSSPLRIPVVSASGLLDKTCRQCIAPEGYHPLVAEWHSPELRIKQQGVYCRLRELVIFLI